jgi:protein-S-isoprenylcysteine O-methyltransferase Ste14
MRHVFRRGRDRQGGRILHNIHAWVIGAWDAIVFFWLITAFRLKRAVQVEGLGQRLRYMSILVVAAVLLFMQWPNLGPLNSRAWPDLPPFAITGLVLTFAGVLIAIVARGYLGANWSGRPSIKEGHELIRKGPYTMVRHPIYSGILLAAIGTAIAFGQTRNLFALPLVLIGFWLKLHTEEQFLTQAFGEHYLAYQKSVKSAIIPYIL